MIKGRDLENRAEGLSGVDEQAHRNGKDAAASARLVELEQRIAQARTLKPSGRDLHCEDCFTRGRDAVLKLLAG